MGGCSDDCSPIEFGVSWAWQREGLTSGHDDNSALTLKAALLVPSVLHVWKREHDEHAGEGQQDWARCHMSCLDRPMWGRLYKALLEVSTIEEGAWDYACARISKQQFQVVLERLCNEAVQHGASTLMYRTWTLRLVAALVLLTATTLFFSRLGLALILLPALILGPILGILVILEMDASSSLRTQWRLVSSTPSQSGISSKPATTATDTGPVGASLDTKPSGPESTWDSAAEHSTSLGLEPKDAAEKPTSLLNSRASIGNLSMKSSVRLSSKPSLSSRLSIGSRLSFSSARSLPGLTGTQPVQPPKPDAGLAAKMATKLCQDQLALAYQVQEMLSRSWENLREEDVEQLYNKLQGDELKMAVELEEAALQQQQQLQENAQTMTFQLPAVSMPPSFPGRYSIPSRPSQAHEEVEQPPISPRTYTRFKPSDEAVTGQRSTAASTPQTQSLEDSQTEGCPWGRDSSRSMEAQGTPSLAREPTLAIPSSTERATVGTHISAEQPTQPSAPAAGQAIEASTSGSGIAAKLGALFGSGKHKKPKGLKQHVLGSKAQKAVKKAQAKAAAEAQRLMGWKVSNPQPNQPGRVYERVGMEGLYFQENIAPAGALTHVKPDEDDNDDEDDERLKIDNLGLDMDNSLDMSDTMLGSCNNHASSTSTPMLTQGVPSFAQSQPSLGMGSFSMHGGGAVPEPSAHSKASSSKSQSSSKLLQAARQAVKKMKSQLAPHTGSSSSSAAAPGKM